MPLIDNKRAWILKMFRMEASERGMEHCMIFPEGTRNPFPVTRKGLMGLVFGKVTKKSAIELPLEPGEHVFGVFKSKYVLSDVAFMQLSNGTMERVKWSEITSLQPKRRDDEKRYTLKRLNGSPLTIEWHELRQGWSGRIGQLMLQMVERHGHRDGRPRADVYSIDEFASSYPTSDHILPNIEPRPNADEFIQDLRQLLRSSDVLEILLELAPDEPEPVVVGIFMKAIGIDPAISAVAEKYQADGILEDEGWEDDSDPTPWWKMVWD